MKVDIDLSIPQEIINALRHSGKIMAQRIRNENTDVSADCALELQLYSEKLSPAARLMVEEIISILNHESARN